MFSRRMNWFPSLPLIYPALVSGLMYPLPMSAATPAPDDTLLVYIGTYTGANSKGIYVSRFKPATGQLTVPELAAETASPSFLALHPNQRFLYAVAEVHNPAGKRIGALRAFSVDRSTGRLALLNQASSGGGGSCISARMLQL